MSNNTAYSRTRIVAQGKIANAGSAVLAAESAVGIASATRTAAGRITIVLSEAHDAAQCVPLVCAQPAALTAGGTAAVTVEVIPDPSAPTLQYLIATKVATADTDAGISFMLSETTTQG
jgi:hypothetical protein